MTSLRTNQMNGMVTDLAAAYKLPQRGIACIFVHFADIVRDFQIHVIYVTDKIMKKLVEDVRAFLAGGFETVQYMKAREPDMSKLYTEKFLPGASH